VAAARLSNYSAIVAAGGEQEGDLGIGEKMNLVHRAPRCDVIARGADSKDRRANVAQRDWSGANMIAALGQIVVEKEMAQIFGMHSIRHARGVRIPCHRSINGSRSPIR
jgi:hypothetical protein